jgi:hypothetical protein
MFILSLASEGTRANCPEPGPKSVFSLKLFVLNDMRDTAMCFMEVEFQALHQTGLEANIGD